MSVFSMKFNCLINDIFDATNRYNYGEITKETLEKQIQNYIHSYEPSPTEFQDLLVAYHNDHEIKTILMDLM